MNFRNLLIMLLMIIVIPMDGEKEVYVTNLPEMQEVDEFRKQVGSWLNAQKFEELDKTANELWKNKSRWKTGLWKLRTFYGGLSNLPKGGKGKAWKKYMDLHEEWVKAFPSSAAAKVALANAYCRYAWDALALNYSELVSNEGRLLFKERLTRARQILDESENLSGKDPEWYCALLIVALGQKWSLEEYDKVYKKAMAFEPTYFDIYFDKMQYLMPTWRGKEDDWIAFAEETADNTKVVMGDEMYTRILWAQSHHHNKAQFFKENDISWERMKLGFLDMEKKYPDSMHNLSAFCHFACLAGDQKTAVELFKRLGNNCDYTVWEDEILGFKKWKSWADPSSQAVDSRIEKKYDTPSMVMCLSYSPDGSKIAAGCSSGQVFLVDLIGDKIFSTSASHSIPVRAVAFSPNGKILATATSLDDKPERSKNAAEIRIWDVSNGAEIATYEANHGNTWGLCFSMDGKTLFSGGEGLVDRPGIASWDVDSQKIRNTFEFGENKNAISSMACSPDRKILAFGGKEMAGFWSVETGNLITNFVASTEKRTWIMGVAFSSDGKTLATCSMVEGEKLKHPGEIKLWDVTTATLKQPLFEGHRDPCLSVSFSPDGKLLATGSADKTLCLWDLATGQKKGSYNSNYWVRSVAFSPDGKKIAVGGGDQSIKIFELEKFLK